jgi:hypothetical protein
MALMIREAVKGRKKQGEGRAHRGARGDKEKKDGEGRGQGEEEGCAHFLSSFSRRLPNQKGKNFRISRVRRFRQA